MLGAAETSRSRSRAEVRYGDILYLFLAKGLRL